MLDQMPSPGWRRILKKIFAQPWFKELEAFVAQERAQGPVYPPVEEVWKALEYTALEEVRVVIVGQDPYHGPGQAHGLAFSVPPGVPLPPSLRNICKELRRDLPQVGSIYQGDLSAWAKQGVLLLNTTLTVRAHQAGSHQRRGWEQVTDALLKALNTQKEGLVVLLWGSHAQQKTSLFDAERHLILQAAHPSPLSAHRGFMGCGHFSAVNHYLREKGEKEIDWRL
jgi:uracil-DNA glycosylase